MQIYKQLNHKSVIYNLLNILGRKLDISNTLNEDRRTEHSWTEQTERRFLKKHEVKTPENWEHSKWCLLLGLRIGNCYRVILEVLLGCLNLFCIYRQKIMYIYIYIYICMYIYIIIVVWFEWLHIKI